MEGSLVVVKRHMSTVLEADVGWNECYFVWSILVRNLEIVRAKARVWGEMVERRAPGVVMVFGYSLLAADGGFLTRSGMTIAMLWWPWRELTMMLPRNRGADREYAYTSF